MKETHLILRRSASRHHRPSWSCPQPSWRSTWPWQWWGEQASDRVPTACSSPKL